MPFRNRAMFFPQAVRGKIVILFFAVLFPGLLLEVGLHYVRPERELMIGFVETLLVAGLAVAVAAHFSRSPSASMQVLDQTDLERCQTEGLFRTVAESSPIGIYIVQDGGFRFVNAKFVEITGYDRDELMSRPCLDLVLPEDREGVRDRAAQMLKGLRTEAHEYRIVSKTGNVRWILETVASIAYEGQRAAVGNCIDITDRRRLEEQLAHLATHDPLTGLPNRRSLEESMNRVVARARRGVTSSLLFLDLDNFKEINDTLGHQVGDQALVAIARLLEEQLREEDLLARLGGDEFAVVLEGIAGEAVSTVAERICRAVQSFPLVLVSATFRLSSSIGAVAIDGRDTPSVLLSRADAAMYAAKEQGGNRVVLSGSQGQPR